MPRSQQMSKKPDTAFALNLLKSMKQPETRYWCLQMDNPVLYYDVDISSAEGREIRNLIINKSSMPKMCKIKKIERIQNPFLMASYLIQKERLVEEYGNKVKSYRLLHGTKKKKIEHIVYENFNRNLIKRHKFGNGIYFTDDIVFARKFCERGEGNRDILVAEVLQSSICDGYKGMEVPDEGCDTSYNKSKSKRNIWVKYDDNTFYPAYKVTCFVPFQCGKN